MTKVSISQGKTNAYNMMRTELARVRNLDPNQYSK